MQPFKPIQLTTAQLWLVHTLETIALGAIVTGAITAYGAVSTGNYNYKVVGGLVLAAVLAVLTKGWSSSIQGNANLVPAIKDYLSNILAIVSQPQPVTIAPQVPPVHIEIHPGAAQPVQVQPNVRQLNAIPPQRPVVQPPIQMPATPQQQDMTLMNTQQMPVPVSMPDMSIQRSFSGLLPAVQPTGQ